MKRSEVIPAVKAALATITPAIPVFEDDFTAAAANAMDVVMKSSGVCLAVTPIMGTQTAGQARQRSAEKAAVRVHLRTNRALAPTFDHYSGIDAAIDAILADRQLRAELAPEATDYVAEDAGLLTHAMNFTVTIN